MENGRSIMFVIETYISVLVPGCDLDMGQVPNSEICHLCDFGKSFNPSEPQHISFMKLVMQSQMVVIRWIK